MKVTALKLQARNKTRVNVYLDGEFAFGLAKILAARLRLGQTLEAADVERLRQQDEVEQAYERALKFLGVRPRSEVEVRRRLRQKDVPDTAVDAVVARLREAGLVDDQSFAGYWVENRAAFRPRSKRVLRAELRQKGVSDEVVRQVLSESDDEASAYTVAAQRARRLQGLEYADFRRKLGDFLARRGFEFDTIGPVVERVWQESQAGEAD